MQSWALHRHQCMPANSPFHLNMHLKETTACQDSSLQPMAQLP